MSFRDRLDAGPVDFVRRVVQKTILGPVKYRSRGGYDANRFWRDRFRRYGTALRGAGDEGLSEEANRRIYEQAGDILVAFAKDAGADLSSARVLDIGCGPGFFTHVLAEHGVSSYTGLDITDVLFADLGRRFPGFRFLRADITRDRLEGEFDLILMIDVAEHIVGAEALDRAAENVREALVPGGLFLIGPLMERPKRHLFYVHFWALDDLRSRFPGYSEVPPVPFRNGSLIGFRRPASS